MLLAFVPGAKMIEKTICCDLCKAVIETSSITRPGKRLRWASEKRIMLCDLTDASASETAICGACLNGLKIPIADGS